jgi:rubrerythrin
MNVVREDVKQCVENELQHAVSVFGLHHSWHEKYAVTLEEVQECVDEAGRMESFLESVFDQIKENRPDKAEQFIQIVEDHAIRCAIEAIQVAAMCRKEIAEQDDRRPTATKHTAMSGSNGYIAYTCGECGKHVGRDARYCGNCGAYFGE